MTLLQKMDGLVYATRLDRIIFMKVEPRSFRWAPLFVMGAMVTGYAMMAKTVGMPDSNYLIGWLLFYCAFLVAAFIRVFGPRFTPTALHPLDERELMVKARAHAISGIVLVTLAMLGCFYMATIGLPGLWHPNTTNDWINLGFGIQASGILLPTWIASWLQPRPATDQ